MRMRITASEVTRKKRGFEFQSGVDDAESECGLDDVDQVDHIIENNGDESPEKLLDDLIHNIKEDLGRMKLKRN